MKFSDHVVDKEHHLSLGFEEESEKYYLSIPVSNGIVDYEEYYWIDKATFDEFQYDLKSAAVFADKCRARKMDDRLIQKPGRNRGTPV